MRKPTKRKMYHKRRKKEKADQRKNAKIPAEMTKTKIPPNPTTKYKYNNKTYQQNQKDFTAYNKGHHQHEFMIPLNSYTQGLQLWWQTYCTAIQYHTQQQKQWNNEISHLQIPTNDGHNLTLLEKYAREYETSSEEEDEDVEQKEEDNFVDYTCDIDENIDSKIDDVDDEYLTFLEITHKHKEELRLKK